MVLASVRLPQKSHVTSIPLCKPRQSAEVGQAHLYLQVSSSHFMVDDLLVPVLLLRDGDVGQRRLKIQDLLHLLSRRLLIGASQEHPQLHHVVQVPSKHLHGGIIVVVPPTHGTSAVKPDLPGNLTFSFSVLFR